MSAIRQVTFPDGTRVAALGQGTWYMGESPSHAAEEIRALQLGIDLGIGVVMAENLRTGLIWKTFMQNPEVLAAMDLCGFQPA